MTTDDPVGCELHLETSLGEEVIGEVWAYDKPSNILVLKQQGSSPSQHNVIILRTNYIKNIKNAKRLSDTQNGQDIEFSKLKDRHAKAEQKVEDLYQRIGIGVTPEGQRVYDALRKTMPCRWLGKRISFWDEVVIDEPYTVAALLKPNSHAETNGKDLVQRVQQVLDAERKRMGLDA